MEPNFMWSVLDLPDDLLLDIYVEWVAKLSDLSRLDTALLERSKRNAFLNIIRGGAVFEGDSQTNEVYKNYLRIRGLLVICLSGIC
jgi:hypothetical protein